MAKTTSLPKGGPSPLSSSSSLPPSSNPPPSSASKGKRKRERDSVGGEHSFTPIGALKSGIASLADEDEEPQVEEDERLDERTRQQLTIVLKAIDTIPSILTLRLSSAPPPGTRPHRTLLELISSDPVPTPSLIHAFLDVLSPPSTMLPAAPMQSEESKSGLTRAQNIARFSETVKNVVDGLGKGRRGKGVDFEQPRKVALYQKLPTFGNGQGGGTFFTNAIETEEEILETGNAELIEVHTSAADYSRTAASDRPLGETFKARPRRSFGMRPKGHSLHPTMQPVEFINPPSLFSSFAPSYDSSLATMSVYQSTRLLQSQYVLERSVEQLGGPSSSHKRARIEDSNQEQLDVEASLEKNWTRVRRLHELQKIRVAQGKQAPEDEEHELASFLQSSLANLVSLRPTIASASSSTALPALLPSPSAILSLQVAVGQSNASSGYQGSLDPSKGYALTDNATLKLHQSMRSPQLPRVPSLPVPVYGLSSALSPKPVARPGLPHSTSSATGTPAVKPARQFVSTTRPSTLGAGGWATGGGTAATAAAAGGGMGALAPVGVLQWAKTTPGPPGAER